MGFIAGDLPTLEKVAFGALGGTIQYVARLDRATQYWQLTTPIELQVGDEVSFYTAKEAGAATTKQWFASGSGFRINVQANNKIEEVGGDLYLDGFLVTNYVTDFPIDGEEHGLLYIITSASISIKNLGASESGFEKLAGYLAGFSVKRNGVVIHEIPLTNKAQGATQLATVGSVNAFMPNYTESVWKDKSKL